MLVIEQTLMSFTILFGPFIALRRQREYDSESCLYHITQMVCLNVIRTPYVYCHCISRKGGRRYLYF